MSMKVNKLLYTEIQIALVKNDLEFIKELINKNYDINQILYPEANKHCLLTNAVIYEASNVVKFLVDNGANVNYDPYKE